MSNLAFTLKRKIFKSPLGLILAIGDDEALYRLEFTEECPVIQEKESASILSIQKELKAYFEGTLQQFKTPLNLQGTPFQKRVWEELQAIPYGETWSYTELASSVGNPLACRAVAQANGANPVAIVVPCHRVINKGGGLGGYASGLERKKWLLEHEDKMFRNR